MITKLANGKLIVDDEIVVGKSLYIEKDRIKCITVEDLPCDETIDLEGCCLSPGFIDIHTHGGGGFDFMDGDVTSVRSAMQLHLKHGTTAIMPTTLSGSSENIRESLSVIAEAVKEKSDIPRFLGVHLEGPYFSPAQSGAQNPDYLRLPDPNEYEAILDEFEGLVRRWSFAPEMDGAYDFCERLVQRGVLPSIGHTDAYYEEVKGIYERGCRSITHFYSCMSGIRREKGVRRLGVIEAGYLLDGLYVELIADGMHLPPDLLKMIVKLKGKKKICLVTDSMRGAGQGSGASFLGKRGEEVPCIIEDGVAKLPDRSAYAGSVATTDRLVRTMVQQAQVTLCEAVGMMTANPALLLGRTDLGRLAEGYAADLSVFDEGICIKRVFVAGRQLFVSNN